MGKSVTPVQPGSGRESSMSTPSFSGFAPMKDTDMSQVMYSGPKQDFGIQVPANDLVRRVREAAAGKVGGVSGFRMAGDRLSPMTATSSMAEATADMKYSPESTSKSGSKYLTYGSSPTRVSGS